MMNQVVVWVLPDGRINTTSFNELAKKPDETDDEFIKREVQKLIRSKPGLAQIPRFIKTKAEIRAVILASQSQRKRALRSDQQGNLFIDQNYVDPDTQRKDLRESAKEKLVALGLTDDEVKAMVR